MILHAFKHTVIGFMQTDPDEVGWPRDMRYRLNEVDLVRDLPIMVQARGDSCHASASAINLRLFDRP